MHAKFGAYNMYYVVKVFDDMLVRTWHLKEPYDVGLRRKDEEKRNTSAHDQQGLVYIDFNY